MPDLPAIRRPHQHQPPRPPRRRSHHRRHRPRARHRMPLRRFVPGRPPHLPLIISQVTLRQRRRLRRREPQPARPLRQRHIQRDRRDHAISRRLPPRPEPRIHRPQQTQHPAIPGSATTPPGRTRCRRHASSVPGPARPGGRPARILVRRRRCLLGSLLPPAAHRGLADQAAGQLGHGGSAVGAPARVRLSPEPERPHPEPRPQPRPRLVIIGAGQQDSVGQLLQLQVLHQRSRPRPVPAGPPSRHVGRRRRYRRGIPQPPGPHRAGVDQAAGQGGHVGV